MSGHQPTPANFPFFATPKGHFSGQKENPSIAFWLKRNQRCVLANFNDVTNPISAFCECRNPPQVSGL